MALRKNIRSYKTPSSPSTSFKLSSSLHAGGSPLTNGGDLGLPKLGGNGSSWDSPLSAASTPSMHSPSNNSNMTVNLTVKTWTMHTLTFELKPSDTIDRLKEEIRDAFGTDTNSQCLTYCGRSLEGNMSISDCKLGKGSTVISLTLTPSSANSMRVFAPSGLSVAAELASASMGCQLFCFDMDDTLTRNAVLVPGIKSMLETLREKGHFLSIASFNRSAVEVLRMNKVDHLFHVIACGWNIRSRKTQHIAHCFRVLGWSADTPRKCFFFDDQMDNIRDVRREYEADGNVHAVFVSNPRHVPSLVNQCLDLCEPNATTSSSTSFTNGLPDIASPLSPQKGVKKGILSKSLPNFRPGTVTTTPTRLALRATGA